MQSNVRAFIATIPDHALTKSLRQTCRSLQRQITDRNIRWIAPDNWHITLRFLGEISPTQIKDIAVVLNEKLAGHRSFNITLEGIHYFPFASQPRVIAALFKSSPALQQLAGLAESAAQNIGLAPETKPFRPHLSLARCRTKQRTSLPQGITVAQHQLCVDQILLFTSKLTPSGPIYQRVWQAPLDAA